MNATLRTHPSAALAVERTLRAVYEGITAFAATYRAAALREQHTQNAIRELYNMSDRELRDIGLTRGEIEYAVRGPGR